MDIQRYSRRAFDAVTPGSREAKALTASLEMTVLQDAMAAIETAAQAAIARLNAAGHALERDESEGALAFRGPAGFGDAMLRLDISIVGTVSAELVPANVEATSGGEEERRFYECVEIARQKEQRSGYRSLSADERLVLCVAEFEAEVNNGGFLQFFVNSAGDRSAVTLRFLERIGASVAAELLREAMSLFPDGKPPASRSKREQLLPDIERRYRRRFEQLDARFYESEENLAALTAVTLTDVPPPSPNATARARRRRP